MADEAPAQPLTAARLAPLLRRVHHALARHRDEIDDLNVFPVPDGDTGSNLVLTARAAVDAFTEADSRDADALSAMVRGALTGARGNSGVILSQVLRALADAMRAVTSDPVAAYEHALRRACELAYDAVAEPVEGTMLTVIRVAADTAEEGEASTLEELSASVVGAVSQAVQRTRVQLDANRKAGVVDAGARGFEVFVQAVHDHLTGTPARDDTPPPVVAREPGRRAEREGGSPEYRFEVQYLLHADDAHAPKLRDRLRELGDSVVVVGAGDVMNVHVHTNRVGEAIEAGVAIGEPARIEVTEFADQIAEREAGLARADAAAGDGAAEGEAGRPLAPVAVLDGDGLRALAERMTATVVPGASGRLPTVADLLNAVGRTDGERVVLLPGHPNAIPTAHQASAVSVAEGGRELIVIAEADAPPSVLAALAVCEPSVGADRSLEEMRDAAAACRCGEVVAATRDAETPVGAVREGQALAVVEGEVVGAFDDPVAALSAVLEALETGTAEVATIIVGAGVDGDEREQAERAVRGALGAAVELDLVDGGQRPQRYHVGVE